MPIYEYRCGACNATFDKLIRSIHHLPVEIHCPHCDSSDVNRIISAPTIRTGSSATSYSDAGQIDAGTTDTPVVGRKEIQAAQKKKAELKERAKYNDWD